MLTELYAYVHQDPPPADAETTRETMKYLEACNNLFEKGFLCHEKITSLDSTVLQNISNGYNYFTTWLSTLLSEGMQKGSILLYSLFVELVPVVNFMWIKTMGIDFCVVIDLLMSFIYIQIFLIHPMPRRHFSLGKVSWSTLFCVHKYCFYFYSMGSTTH